MKKHYLKLRRELRKNSIHYSQSKICDNYLTIFLTVNITRLELETINKICKDDFGYLVNANVFNSKLYMKFFIYSTSNLINN